MSKLLAQAHAWYPEKVSWTWKFSLKRASYRWWLEWKRKVSWLHKWAAMAWSISYSIGHCFCSLSWMNYTTLWRSMTPKILFFSLIPHLRCFVLDDQSKCHRMLHPFDEPSSSWCFARLSKMVHKLINSSITNKKTATAKVCWLKLSLLGLSPWHH